MSNQKKRLLNTLNHKLLSGIFVFCLAVAAGTIGCSDSGGGGSKIGYHLSGYDGVVSEPSTRQSLVSAVGNQGLEFYAEFPWFVNLTYQVFDADNWGVADLTVDDFMVLEDGAEVSKLASEMNIRKRDALPSAYSYGIKTVLFLDNTPSLPITLEKMLEAGQVVVDNMDEKQQQEIAIVAYNEAGEAEVVQDFTSSRTDLNTKLSLTGGIQQSYGTTNFYSGVISALALWEDNHTPANPDFQQGFLVVVTDGKDTTSLSDVNDAIAVRGDKQVIAIAVGKDIPDNILNDLEKLGNGGFYHVTDPLIEPDPKFDKKENLCEHMLEVQNRMMAYADGFYWLRYKTAITGKSPNPDHAVKLTIVKNRNDDADSRIAGTFNSDILFSGEPDIYFNTSASDPNGLFDEDTGRTEKTIMLERGQAAGEVAETITAITYKQSGASPSQYEWTSGNTRIVTVRADAKDSAKAVVTVVGPGDVTLTVKDTANNITQTLTIKVKVREEGFEMLRHAVTSRAPWFADATFQVRKTYNPADYDKDNPWRKRWEWVTDLTREDMTVMESGRQVDMEDQELHLRKRDNIPSSYTYTLKTVLLIDNSPSTRAQNNLNLMKQAANAFAKRALINDPKDRTDLGPLLDENNGTPQQEIAVVSYDEDGETILVQDFSTDFDTVTTAIDNIVRGFGPIDFYDGMLDSLHLWDTDNAPYDAGDDFVQGVVVVLSDGWQSNPGFYDRQAVLDETGSKQIICVGVGDDLLSGNSDDLIAFGNAGFYSVPDPGQTTEVTLYPDNRATERTTKVIYTALQQTLMGIQDNAVYPYANSFYWLDYKSGIAPAPTCERAETMTVSINNNNNTGSGRHVIGKFESCNFFEGVDGMIYVNQTVTNPDGITDDIDLKYVMLGNIPLNDPVYPLEAFTYDDPYEDSYVKNTPAYEWRISNQNIVRVTPDPRSYANSRAVLSLPPVKRPGSTSLRIDDTGNSVWKNIYVNVSKLQLPGPIAYYPFNGNADDETGNGYDGGVFGATLTADRHGNPNSAYSFDGTNDYIALDMFYGPGAGTAGETINEVTVCAWVKSASTKSQIVTSFDRSEYWRLSLNDWVGSGTFGAAFDTTGNALIDDLGTGATYVDGQWHFICATYDVTAADDNKKLYIDGDLVASTEAHNGEPLGTGAVRYGFIGVGSEAGEYNGEKNMPPAWTSNTCFQGNIDDVMIFNTVLTQDIIQLLYDAAK